LSLKDILPANEAEGEIPLCEIHVDDEGDWFHKGNKIIREDILEFFYENLSRTSEGEFLIEWQGSRCRLEAADTPFVISRVDRGSQEQGKDEIFLTFRHLQQAESLAPETLQVGRQNVLYCQIRNGQFPARFSRPAYYQLAEWIQEDAGDGTYYLELNQKKFTIQSVLLT